MFLNIKKDNVYNLVVAFKSSSVDIQLISDFYSNKKEVIFSKQIPIFLEDSQDSQKYTKQYIFELRRFLSDNSVTLKQLSKGKINSVKIILYSPWFTSKINSISHEENTFITEEFIKEKLKDIKSEENLKVLEKRVIKLEANGYTLFDIKKIKYPEVNLTTYVSYISRDIHKTIVDCFKENFPNVKEHSFISSPLLTLQNIRQFMIHEDNVVFFHVGEEITEIGVIQDDTLSFFATYPIGIHDFLRVIQANIKTYDYDLLYQKEVILKSEIQNQKINQIKEDWIANAAQSLEVFSHVPNKVIFLTNRKTEAFFIDLLQNTIKQGKTKVFENHRIISFDISNLKDIIEYKTPLGENSIDLVLEALI